jgi:hypothetical protein
MQLEPRRAQVVYESQFETTPTETQGTVAQSTEPTGVSEVSSLEDRLNQVTATPEAPQPETVEAPSVSEPEATEPVDELETQKDDEALEAFAKQLEQFYGITPDGLREMKEFVETAKAAQAAESLRNEWGVERDEFDQRMNLVLERFEKLPPTMQQALDNNEGIKLLWNNIQAEQGATTPQRPNVPTFDRANRGAPTQSPFLFTQSELNALPADQYAKMNPQILLAYANGQVDLNN